MIHQRLFNSPSPLRSIQLRAALLLCVLACASSTSAQRQTPATIEDEEAVRVQTNLVKLNVGVADLKGRPITDLTGGDFAVYENGVRQTIQSFEPTQAPFSLVLLLDMSGSTLNFRTTLKQSATRFIDALAPQDRVAVVAFWGQRKKGKLEDKLETLANFTTDHRLVAFAIDNAKGSGETNFYRALQYSLDRLAKESSQRKAVVVLTDGIDTDASKQDRLSTAQAQTGDEALALLKPEANPALSAVLNAADRQGVTVYPLALPSGNPKLIPIPTPQQVAIYTAARVRMQALADRTGGRVHEINRLEDMGRLYAQVAAEIRTLYTIAYQSSTAAARSPAGTWRKINIEVARPELLARTRPGYFAR